MRLLTFKHGIHPDYHKWFTREKGIRKTDLPQMVVIPLKQHLGAICNPIVNKGDEVKVGQKLGDNDAFVSCPVHSSISGIVKSIGPYQHPGGDMVDSITIESDGKDEPFRAHRPPQDISTLQPDEIRNIIRETGIVGLGGAAFPTHVKLNPPKEKQINTVIINGAECEPYLTADHRLMLERSEDIIYGIKAVMKLLGVRKSYIGIEANKKDAIAVILKGLEKEKDADISVVSMKVKYPEGAEKMLIYAILKREVPAGGLPMDVGVVVQNVGTTIAIADAIQRSKPLIERVVTVTGLGVKRPGNLLVKIGTLFSDVIKECGGLKDGARKVLMGGPMMGIAQYSLQVPVVKGTSGIVVLVDDELKLEKTVPCIGCGNCVKACPMFLLPTRLASYTDHDMLDKADEYGILDCIECGSCVYVCPSKLHLVQLIRLGKAKILDKKRGKGVKK